jgi:hypothetical protein
MKMLYRSIYFFLLGLVLIACAPLSPSSPAVTSVVGIATPPPGNGASFRKSPYLIFPGNNTSMTIMWQTDKTPAIGRIEWGETELYQTGQATIKEDGAGADEHQFAYTIEGLKPGSRIYYRVSVDGTMRTGTFMTAASNDASTLVFYAYGDTRTDPRTHNGVLAGLLKDVEKNPSARQTFLLHAGDYVTYGLSEKYWDSEYFNPVNQYLATTLASLPMIGALGNHEEYVEGSFTQVCPRSGELFRKYFPYPMYVDPKHFYYSFDYGPVHVAVIDPYTADYTKETGEEYKWLKNDLSQSRPFKIVLMHPPAWSANGSGFALRQNLHELFKASGVSLVLQGHEHYFSRLVVDGIPYLTIGGGGAPLTRPNFFDPSAYNEKENTVTDTCIKIPFVGDPKIPAVTLVDPQKAARQYHFARIEIAAGKLKTTVINVEGRVIDCIPDDETCAP